jgi:hypothetical protein
MVQILRRFAANWRRPRAHPVDPLTFLADDHDDNHDNARGIGGGRGRREVRKQQRQCPPPTRHWRRSTVSDMIAARATAAAVVVVVPPVVANCHRGCIDLDDLSRSTPSRDHLVNVLYCVILRHFAPFSGVFWRIGNKFPLLLSEKVCQFTCSFVLWFVPSRDECDL